MRRFGKTMLAIYVSVAHPSAATSAPTGQEADRLFVGARTICQRDGGRLWGKSLCAPIMLVDYHDQSLLANQPDREHRLRHTGRWFSGKLPDEVIIANTPTQWAGLRWTQIDSPVPDDAAHFQVLVAHELFHRIQPNLGLSRPEADNHHLDTFDGRYLLLLEWRALARALQTSAGGGGDAALGDALAFRGERYRLFPQAAADEGALETAEGVPEYTGVMLGLTTGKERLAYAIRDLTAFIAAPTFVRSFAYATGPAYGLLLDRAVPGWKSQVRSGKTLYELLAATMPRPRSEGATLQERILRYDDGSLRSQETVRENARQGRLADFRARLVDGPVVVLPLGDSNFQFNPQTLVPLDGIGTVYPTMRLTDVWGSLDVERGGALVRSSTHQAFVQNGGASPMTGMGAGWRLQLKPGWTIAKGLRPGDLAIIPAGNAK